MNAKTKKPRTKTRISMKKRPGGGVARSWLSIFMAAMLVVGLAPAPVFATGETNPQATPGKLTIGGADNIEAFTFYKNISGLNFTFGVATRPADASDYKWSISEGTLPDGLSLEPGDYPWKIALSGTPTKLTEKPVSVTLKVESKGTSQSYVGTLPINIEVVPPKPDDLAYEILSKASCVVDMATANTQDDVKAWLDTWLINVLKADLDSTSLADFYIEPITDSFQAATMGTPENPTGTAGSLKFNVNMKMHGADGVAGDVVFYKGLTCTITPTPVYQLTVEGGTIESTGKTTGFFPKGTQVAITTKTLAAGETFQGWLVAQDAKGTLDDPTKAQATFTMGDGNATVSASYNRELLIEGSGDVLTFYQGRSEASYTFSVAEATRPAGATSYTWSITEGALPAGLSLTADKADPARAMLSGTPTALTERPVELTLNVQNEGDGEPLKGTLKIKVLVAQDPFAAAAKLLKDVTCEVPMTEANSQPDVEAWLAKTWLTNISGLQEALGDISLANLVINPVANSFKEATMGTQANPEGTSGSLTFSVAVNTTAKAAPQIVCENLTCTIKPTPVYKLTLERGKIVEADSSTGYFTEGTEVTIDAGFRAVGEVFAHWELSAGSLGSITDTKSETTTFTIGAGDATVSAIFGEHVHDGHVYLPYDGTGEIPEYAYLTKDVSSEDLLWPTHLCLNGKKLTANLEFAHAGSSLYDHTGGSLKGSIAISSPGTLAMHGGSITGIVSLATVNASFTIYNGSIAEGVEMIGTGNSFIMHNGTVKGNVVMNMVYSVFNMSGGTILGGFTLNNGEIRQSGGSISGGIVAGGGSISQTSGSISGTDYGLRVLKDKICALSSSYQITGKKAAVYLEEGARLNVSGIKIKMSVLSVASEVVPTKDNPVNITMPASRDLSEYFTSAMSYASIKNSGTGNAQVVQLVYDENALTVNNIIQNGTSWNAQFKPSGHVEGSLSLESKVHNPTKDDLKAAIEAAGGSQIAAQSYTVPSSLVATNAEGALINGKQYPIGQVLTYNGEEVVCDSLTLFSIGGGKSYEISAGGKWTRSYSPVILTSVNTPVVVNGASYVVKYQVKDETATYLFLYRADGTPAGRLLDLGENVAQAERYIASFNPGCDPDSLLKVDSSDSGTFFNKNGQTYQLTTLLSQDLTVLKNGQATPTRGTITLVGTPDIDYTFVASLHYTGNRTYDYGTASKVGTKLQIAYPEAYQSPFMVFAYQPVADPTVIVVNDAGSKTAIPATGDTTPFAPLLLLALTAAATTLLTHRKRQTS